MVKNAAIIRIVVIAVLVLSAGSWAGNLWIYNRSQLPEPVFFKHYIEIEYGEGASFELAYLENKSAENHIQTIRIPELPEAKIQPWTSYENYTHQVEGLMRVSISNADMSGKPGLTDGEPMIIRQVETFFDDGTSKIMDIGEIRVYAPGSEAEDVARYSSSGASSEGTGYDRLKMLKDAELTGIVSGFMPQLADHWRFIFDAKQVRMLDQNTVSLEEIQVGSEAAYTGAPIEAIPYPVKLEADEFVTLAYRMNVADHTTVADQTDVYHLMFRMEMKDEEGNTYRYPAHISYTPSLTNRQVAEYVQIRRAGQ
ncbi:hypothetical protein [Paenibacillus sp. DYY-L-2]|uniref:hypothetical protein n=1 Tax=Paenibacillus sp. DYY-L-2 TaxID=3447013 RepID=UPI003F50211D